MTASTTATAVAGYVEGVGAETLLPITIPLTIINCDNTGKFYTVEDSNGTAVKCGR